MKERLHAQKLRGVQDGALLRAVENGRQRRVGREMRPAFLRHDLFGAGGLFLQIQNGFPVGFGSQAEDLFLARFHAAALRQQREHLIEFQRADTSFKRFHDTPIQESSFRTPL